MKYSGIQTASLPSCRGNHVAILFRKLKNEVGNGLVCIEIDDRCIAVMCAQSAVFEHAYFDHQ